MRWRASEITLYLLSLLWGSPPCMQPSSKWKPFLCSQSKDELRAKNRGRAPSSQVDAVIGAKSSAAREWEKEYTPVKSSRSEKKEKRYYGLLELDLSDILKPPRTGRLEEEEERWMTWRVLLPLYYCVSRLERRFLCFCWFFFVGSALLKKTFYWFSMSRCARAATWCNECLTDTCETSQESPAITSWDQPAVASNPWLKHAHTLTKSTCSWKWEGLPRRWLNHFSTPVRQVGRGWTVRSWLALRHL